MRRGPFDDNLAPETRRDLGQRLVELLRDGPLDVRGMAAGLGVEPEVVVAALREARAATAATAGTLRSTIHLGRVTWWWEADSAELELALSRRKKLRSKKG